MKIKVKAKFEISKKEMKEVMKMINELEKNSMFKEFLNRRNHNNFKNNHRNNDHK